MEAIARFLEILFEKAGFVVMVLTINITTDIGLFVPTNILKKIKLDNLVETYGEQIGIAFVISSIYLGIVCVWKIFNLGKGIYIKRKYNKLIERNIENLSHAEVKALCPFCDNQNKEIQTVAELDLYDPQVNALEQKKLIRRISETAAVTTNFSGSMSAYFCYKLNDKVKCHLEEMIKKSVDS